MDKDVKIARELEEMEAENPLFKLFGLYRKVIVDLLNRVRYLERVFEDLKDDVDKIKFG